MTRPWGAPAYEEHLRSSSFPALKQIPGFIDASILRRPVQGGVEFLVVSRWASIEAIQEFAGSDSEVAVVPAEVQAMMVEYDRRVRHYEGVDWEATSD